MSKKWIPVEKQPYNGQRVLLSFADEKQGRLWAFIEQMKREEPFMLHL